MNAYKIKQDLLVNCRIYDVVEKSNFIVVKFCNDRTNEHLFTLIRKSGQYEVFHHDMITKNIHTIHRIALESHTGVYHFFTWDDVDRGICSRDKVGEIQRDENGNPIIWKVVITYEALDGRHYPNSIDQYYKDFIEINHMNVKAALDFNNREHYLAEIEAEKEREQAMEMEAYYRMVDAAEQRKWGGYDMNEEDRIMDALENGDGEYYGY